jgi:hypothetical protein
MDWTPAINNRRFTKKLLYRRSGNVELLVRHDCHTGAAATAVVCGSLVLPCNVINGHLMTALHQCRSLAFVTADIFWWSSPFLGAFTILRKATITVVMSVYVRLPLNRFLLNLIYEYFWKISVEKIQVSLKSDKNNGYYPWRREYIFNNITLNSS